VDDASSIAGLFVSVDGASAYDWKTRITAGQFVLSSSDLHRPTAGRFATAKHRVEITAQDAKGLLSDVWDVGLHAGHGPSPAALVRPTCSRPTIRASAAMKRDL